MMTRWAAGAAVLVMMSTHAYAQTTLPTVTVVEPKPKKPMVKTPKTTAVKRAAVTQKPTVIRSAAARRSRGTTSGGVPQAAGGARGPIGGGPDQAAAAPGPATSVVSPQVAAARASESEARAVRENIQPRGPANATTFSKANVDALPAGNQTGFNQVLLNLPGISQDSSGSGDFHIRNEHANAQYRINGIFLPDGVSGFSQVLDSVFIRNVTLLDGALPAQYGLRTAGIIDIETRTGADAPGTIASIYGGSFRTIVPTITTSGVSGRWDYFVTGRYNANALGIENPLPTRDAIHDNTRQGRYFAYISGLLEDNSRLTFMSGASLTKYQIPNSPGTPPAFAAFGVDEFNSALLNENQLEHSLFNVIAWQKSIGPLDTQISYFQRYSTLRYNPDVIGDLVFNGVASDVSRLSLVNGLQTDNAYHTSARNTVRFGAIGNVEQADALDANLVLPTNRAGDPIDRPTSLNNFQRKTGAVAGIYLQDEYFLTPQFAVTAGLRYDYMHQYVDADQLSPRLGAVWKPTETTTFHAGYARYFTPPVLVLSGQTNLAATQNTTIEPEVNRADPARPERSHYFDVGVTQRVLPGLDIGVDGYYKIARNLLDDGQFGQALVLTTFNYDRAYNEGVEFKANYQRGNFSAYGNVAVARQRATEVSSNQYLFEADELAYINRNYIPTDHDQLVTVSGGAAYRVWDTLFSTNVLYGSGLRNGFANLGTVSPHAVVNLGLAHDFQLSPTLKPTTFRITVVNVGDIAYAIRDGSGIGVFQAQYGSRRGFFAGLSQQF